MPRLRPTKEVDGVTWWLCSKCKNFKCPSDFYLLSNGKLYSMCKACEYERAERDKERRRGYLANWRKENRYTLLVKKREYHHSLKEFHNAKSRRWYAEHRD